MVDAEYRVRMSGMCIRIGKRQNGQLQGFTQSSSPLADLVLLDFDLYREFRMARSSSPSSHISHSAIQGNDRSA